MLRVLPMGLWLYLSMVCVRLGTPFFMIGLANVLTAAHMVATLLKLAAHQLSGLEAQNCSTALSSVVFEPNKSTNMRPWSLLTSSAHPASGSIEVLLYPWEIGLQLLRAPTDGGGANDHTPGFSPPLSLGGKKRAPY